jgi:DNA-binding CsgD family transcriptional regulator
LRKIVNTSKDGHQSTKTRNRRTSGSGLPLTQRERDILTYLPTRLSTIDIATKLHISPNTVKTHLKSIYHKLEARSRNEAIVHAVQRGLISDTAAEVLMLQSDRAPKADSRP